MSQEGKGEDKDRKTSGARSFAGSVWEVNVQATAVFGETLHGGPLDELAQHWLLSDREQGQGGKQPWWHCDIALALGGSVYLGFHLKLRSPEGAKSREKLESHCICLWAAQKLDRMIQSWVQFSSVTQLCLTLHDPVNCSTPDFLVHHQLPELAQTHVHWVGDAIQPSHLPSSPSPPAFTLSQHQGLFQGVSLSHLVAKGFQLQFQHQWIFRTDFLYDWLIWSPCSPRDS